MRIEEVPGSLIARLRARRAEVEEAVLARAEAISDPGEVADPRYAEGLRTAVSAAIEYGLDVFENREDHAPAIPVELLGQARLAARNGVGLDKVLRRYVAGHVLLGDYLIAESERAGGGGRSPIRGLLRVQAALFDRLLAAVSEEYAREAEAGPLPIERRRAEWVDRLLGGELVDTAEIGYDFEAEHVGAVATGTGARAAVGGLAKALGCSRLVVRREEGTVWAWFGSKAGIDRADLDRRLRQEWPVDIRLALGEPARSLAGWRLTHSQALAAHSTGDVGITRYADVAMLASLMQDKVLANSLRRLYLTPLSDKPDGGAVLRQTLRTYFASGRNVTSTAAALVVDRRTVTNRLRVVEECFGRSLEECGVDLQMALRLEELSDRRNTSVDH